MRLIVCLDKFGNKWLFLDDMIERELIKIKIFDNY